MAKIDGVQVVSLIGRTLDATQEVASRFGVGHVTTELGESLARPDVDAVILATPTQLHASQTIACLKAGKHVQVEIPLADKLADAEEVARAQKAKRKSGDGRPHATLQSEPPVGAPEDRRARDRDPADGRADVFLPPPEHQCAGASPLVDRPPALAPRAHTVDLFAYQSGGTIVAANAVQGPIHPELGIAMDMSIQLKSSTGAICTLSLSFNNDGPLGTFFRYICDNGTYIARYDDLYDGKEQKIDVSKVDVSMNGIELQDREFFAAIREGREPNSSVAQVLPCYRTLDKLERQLAAAG
jgi:2-hydroxy-4-carboxymuconate semialdehyde hemiacetal dehydrogenase